MTLPMQAAGKRSHFFDNEGTDHLLAMVMELSSQLWVIRERLFALESVIAQSDEELPRKVETWEASPAEAAKLAEMRKSFLSELFRTLDIERPGPTDEEVLRKAG